MRSVIGITCSLTVTNIEGTIHFLERNQIACDYARVIEYVGGTPVLLPHVENVDCIDHYLGLLDGLLLSGGGDIDPLLFGQEPHQNIGNIDRVRDEMELQLTQKALTQTLPIFATCRGMQVLNVAAGGTICQDIASEMHQPTLCHMQKSPGWHASHTIDILHGSRLQQIVGSTSTRVNSFHHQAVRDMGDGFVATAHSKDGVIEAIEKPTHPFALGVECHPELMWERHADALNLFKAFVKSCR